MKTFSKCMATVFAAAGLLAIGGCSNKNVDNRVTTLANWNVNTSTVVEKNSLEYWQTHKEAASYKVTFTPGSASSYHLTYDAENATYSTEFYMLAEYDWMTDTIENYRSEESEKEPLYVYTSKLAISGVFKLSEKAEESLEFDDVLESTCYYRLAGDNLQPVYSRQIVKNTAPNSPGASSLKDAYRQIDEEYETYYNKKCTQATIKKTAHKITNDSTDVGVTTTTEKKLGISSKDKYSVFDNSQARAAVRSFNLSGGSTRTFNLVSPQNGTMQTCHATVSSPVELKTADEAQLEIINALKAAKDYIFFNGDPDPEKTDELPKNIRYNAVSLSINSGMAGQSPTCWYTAVENKDLNSTRCVLLRVSTPLSFGMGTLVYSLKELKIETV